MLSHHVIWDAIDALAKRHGLSPSGLARLAGLDSTAFNKSKRVSKDGRERWPSTESIAKILEATDEGFETFIANGESYIQLDGRPIASTVPLLGFAEAGQDGFFDANGLPTGGSWDKVNLPTASESGTYALEITGRDMLPLYRDGDLVIVSPTAQIRRGDRVVVRLNNGDIIARILHRQTADTVELQALDGSGEPRVFDMNGITWLARILWASQ